ncbi:uncharacterized protein K02A2.6-like [Wyeomyia smithii]|uniref:uncharacterized protein K02A2.6-like n=1 Tax=Wyeomyia smithii TaxID=174621 RepID=UPI002467DBA3|nr:uncharacterized protein K02A2.6-like [Wyeomyia smithii]
MTDPVSQPGVPPGINPPGQHNGQQQPPFVPQQQPGMQQQTQQQRTDAIIMQILQQLQQQQAVTNQLLQQQQQSAQQQHGFMQQQGTLFRNALSAIQVTVPPNPEVILDSLAGNIREFQYDPENQITFATWYARYEDLFAKDAERIDDEAKVRLLLRRLGTNEHYRYVSYILPRAPKDFSFSETVSKLKGLFGTKESTVKKRYCTLTVTKASTEDYVSFGCRVNKMCVEFELSKLTEEHFKCLMFVCGLKSENDGEVRTRLLTKIEDNNDVTLDALMQECQRMINLRSDTAMIEGPAGHVQAIKGNFQHRKQFRKRSRERSKASSKQEEERKKPSSPCWNCGAMHFSNHCSFKGHKCVDCKQVGHKEGYCASAKRPSEPSKHQSRRFSTKSVTASVSSVECKRRYVWVKINGTPVRLQLDTASDITIVSEQVWNRIGQPAGVPATQTAKSASGEQLDLVCEFVSDVEINGTTHSGRIFVSNHPLNLLGIDLIEKFQLWSLPMDNFCNFVGGTSISKAYLQKAHPKLFSDTLGLCSRTKVQLSLKESCKPVFRPKRPVSYAMLPTVDNELDRLERLQIISPVDYSEWAAPIVVVRKASGNVRICGDYSTGLNDRLQSHQYPLPLPQDIIAKLSNCTVFSQIDLSDAFLQMEVDENCRHLLTINTHRGLYQYNRLPPGVKAAPGAFQQLMDTMLAGLPCTAGYLDDVVVGGKNAAEHQRNLHAVLQRLEEFGFTIRPEKCSFGQQQIRYLGHLLDRHGLRPDPAKIQVIKDLPPPKDITGVRSFLGAINYYGKYVPNMQALRFPLDELLKNTTAFVWTHECQQAFNKFKEILSSELLLAHYDPTQEIIVSADASSIGIGATISHKYPDGHVKVIQHASRALTQVEQRYSQIDREGLAIIYAVTKFHKFIFGRRFHLQTDHQPLLRIFGSKKGIPVYTANRLQRWALSLLSYDFSIEYVQTDKFGNADILSRLINQHTKPDEDVIIACTTLEEDLRSVAIDSSNQLPLSFSMVEKATASDPSLRKVHRFIRDGWPKSRSEIKDRELARYYDRQEALSVVQGSIMFGDRLVIPTMFRRRCLIQLHKGHPGIQRMKAIARSFVYWPGLDDEIVSFVKGCSHCASAARSPPKAEPESWHPTTAPWQRVHADYAGPLDGEFFLLVIDAHTKWPEIFPTSKTTTSATIRLMRKLFANKGMPELLVTDNGSQFKSAQFDDFCCKNGIRHTTTAPYHPQSNGQAERFVDTFKRAVKKIQEGEGSIDEALDVFLLTYRTTPNRNVPGGKSPAEAMYNRPLRTSLDLLRPPSNLEPSSNRQQTSNTRSFSPKACVYAKIYDNNKWSWFPGTVVERIGSVMYNIWVDNRRLIRSHINQLRQRAETATKVQKQGIPLNILLDEWNLPVPASQVTELSEAEELEPSMSTLVAPSPSTPTIRPATVTSSSSSASTAFESAVESSPTVQLPRRSSRTRRLPQRFQAYQRY